MKRFSTFPPAESGDAVASARAPVDAPAILPTDTAQSLRAGYMAFMVTSVTVWIGFVVLAGCGYIMAESLGTLGVVAGLGKPVLLWLPIAIVAATGPVWLAVLAWTERRDLKRRLALVAERDRPAPRPAVAR